ncbi:VIT domain-containing protein [Cellulophaga sp. Z1A5H]|uniref:VIT domain-containing protein n=1 Tax=Cellulophaga sp. Z1A5H TaxID=2687291 RepID=UPI0013FDEACE|nr:VIT domain-containing protein [Cellulophaga sp. Z1A5H]
MKKHSILILFLIFSRIALAQGIPILKTTDDTSKPIQLSDLHINVFVIDNIATTTLEMRFYNANNRVMEGELNFPLGNGITISRFALDVNGEMREGVVVDKETATQAFEAVTRRNVDPGLAEVTTGNNFKARVYPIPAKGYKKAIIAFEHEIKGDAANYIYQLPLHIKNALETFSVKVEVVLNKPKILKSNDPQINLKFTEARNSYISTYKEENKTLESNLSFAIPKPKKVSKVITYKGSVTSDNYFYTHLDITPEQRKKKTPKKITVVWDVSSSVQNRDLEKEVAILQGYFDWMKQGKVTLVTFSNTIHSSKTYDLTNGKNEKLISDLKAEHYDGGTAINAIDFSTFKTEEILLFSDGVSNFGEKNKNNFESPIIAVNTSNIANHSLLAYMAVCSNGTYINAFESATDQAIDKATHEQKQFIRAEFDTNKIKEIFPNNREKITDNFSMSGKIEGDKAELTLHFGFGGEITETKRILIDNAEALDHNLGERIWAQKKLKTLLVDQNVAAIKSHGKKFNLVTPNTSLIVLDDVADYVRYEIVPPASLQEEYFKRIAMKNEQKKDIKKHRILSLCSTFSEDYNWWKNPPIQKSVPKRPNVNDVNIEPVEMVSRDEISDAPQANMEMALEMEMDEVASESKSSEKRSKKKENKPKITIATWDSKAPYINTLKSVAKENVYTTYLELKDENGTNPSFYFDVATYMFQNNQRKEGLRVISNLAELELENTELLRTLGRKLFEFKFFTEALAVFKEVLDTRSFEPHSYIDLGLTYAELGENQEAINNLYRVIDKEWDADIMSRFNGIELITLHDINNIIFKHKEKLDVSFINPCFLKHMPVDVRIVIDWDANETDIDLWITDPNKEKCSYSNKNTRLGGRISYDVTQGYGPEEFRLKHAIDGAYGIDVNFYGTRKQTALGNVTVRALVYTNFGTKDEQKEVLTLQLEPAKSGDFNIGTIEFKK